MNSTEVLMTQFTVADYGVFFVMLGLSVLVGLYFGFYANKNTVMEYLLGSKSLQSFPITMSLISSWVSGVTLLGVPTEVYRFGTQISLIVFGYTAGVLVTLFIFLPVFYKLELLSVYEYLEMRFNKATRRLCSLYYLASLLFFTPVVIYGPALVLNQVSGMGIYGTTVIISVVCIFYTSVGGLKAVVWSDTIQAMFMLCAVIAVLILGVNRVGGFYEIFRISGEGERLEFLNMNPDPRVRMSFWVAVVSYTFNFVGYTSTNPAVVQRLTALPSYEKAKMSLIYMIFGVFVFSIPSMFFGLVIYTAYHSCDIIGAKIVSREDQILPYFVMDVAGHVTGLPGLFAVGVCSAALSTMSTTLNSISGTVFEDFILPLLPKNVSEERQSLIMKIITVIAGIICVLIVGVIDRVDSVLTLTYIFSGVTYGPSLGIFLMATLFPTVSSKGAITGAITSSVCMLLISIGNRIAISKGLVRYATKPMRYDSCLNSTLLHLSNTTQSKILPLPQQESGVLNVFLQISQLTVFSYPMVGSILGILVGLAVSYLTGPLKLGDVHPDLLSPPIRRFLPKKQYKAVPLRENTP